jgi:hypothetical protein
MAALALFPALLMYRPFTLVAPALGPHLGPAGGVPVPGLTTVTVRCLYSRRHGEWKRRGLAKEEISCCVHE